VLRYAAVRLLQMVGVLLGVTFLSFWMLSLLPGDPCVLSVGSAADAELVQQCRAALNLDRNIFVQYLTWWGNLLSGDLGESYLNGIPVRTTIASRLPVTFWLLFYTQILALAVAVPLGIWSAYREQTWTDRLISGGSFALLATPTYVLGVLLALVFAVNLGWFDLSGYVGPTESLSDHWRSLALPTITLAATMVPVYLRLLRTDVIETLKEDYVGVARAKGLSPRYILTRHVLRPSSLTLITVAGISAAQLVNGAIIVEVIFDLDGLGSFLVEAVFAREYLIVQTLVALTAILFIVFNLIVDLLYPVVDPRVRPR
jgi:peptide/nickel transport system permease protein